MKPSKHNRMPETSSCNNSEGTMSQTDPAICETVEGCSDFDCNICLESSRDPVVTMCGHLFCWSCLYKWLNSSCTGLQQCPVCKARIEEKIIPLYGRGKVAYPTTPTTTDNQGDEKAANVIDIPSRPSAPRPHISVASPRRMPQQFTSFHNHGMSFHDGHPSFGGNVPFSASFGLFPALFGFQLSGFPDYSHSLSYNGSSSSSSSFGAPDARGNAMAIQQRIRWNNSQHEFLLHWFFILLVCFGVACFLFF